MTWEVIALATRAWLWSAGEHDDDRLSGPGGPAVRGGTAAGLAPPAAAQPARPVHPGRHLDPAPELRGDRPVPAHPGDDHPADRAAGRAAARAQHDAAGRRLRARLPAARA